MRTFALVYVPYMSDPIEFTGTCPTRLAFDAMCLIHYNASGHIQRIDVITDGIRSPYPQGENIINDISLWCLARKTAQEQKDRSIQNVLSAIQSCDYDDD